MATSTEKRVVSLSLDAKQFAAQIKGLRDQLTGVRAAAEGTQRSIQGISSTLGLLGKVTAAAYAVTRITDFVGAIQDANNVLRSVTDTTEEFTQVQTELFLIANKTGAAIGQTTQAYARIARALQGTGRSSQDALLITERLNKALLVSGASAGEAASTLTQFSQALQSGKLQGDEFRSLTENAPLVIAAIAEVSGQGRAALKELAKEGKLTSEVLVQALAGDAGAAIDAAAEGFEKTIPQAINIFKNQVIQLITTNSTMVNSLGLIAKAIIFVGENLVAVSASLALAFAPSIIAKVVAMTRAVQAFVVATAGGRLASLALGAGLQTTAVGAAAAAGGIGATTVALKFMQAALITTGVGALVVAFGALVQVTSEAASETSTFAEFVGRMGEKTTTSAQSMLAFSLEIQKGLIQSKNYNGVLDEVIRTYDEYIIILDDSASAADREREATRLAALEKQAFADAVREASTALDNIRRKYNDDAQAMRTNTANILAQAAALKTGGKAALEKLKIDQEVQALQSKVYKEQLDLGVKIYKNQEVAGQAASAAAEQQAALLRQQLEAQRTLDAAESAAGKRPKKEARVKEYETLDQILRNIKLSAADAAGALAAFDTGGQSGLDAYTNALERREQIEKTLEDVQRNKIALSAQARTALQAELDVILAKTQTDQRALDIAQVRDEVEARAALIATDKNNLQKAYNILLNEGSVAYEAYLSQLDTERQVEEILAPLRAKSNEDLSKKTKELYLQIEANKALAKNTVELNQKMADSTKQYADIFKNFIDGVISGAVSFKEAIKEMIKALLALIIKQLIFNALARSSNPFLASIGTAGGGTKSAPVSAGGTKSALVGAAASTQTAAYGGKSVAMAAAAPQITINNNAAGVEVTAQRRSDNEIIEITVQKITGMIRSGGNAVAGALENTYGVNRGVGAFR